MFHKKYRGQRHELSLPRKLLMVVLILVFTRILAGIPVPFVNREYLKTMFEGNASLGFLNMFTGGGLSNMSVMALGITPYITASIIIQLMSVVFPKLQELQQGMAHERKTLEKITIILGVALAALQGVSMCIGFGRQGLFSTYRWYSVLVVTLIWTAGTLVASLLGKRITDKYIGNGISLILVANILSSYPGDFMTIYENMMQGKTVAKQILIGAVILLVIFLLFLFTVMVQGSEKRIKVIYSQKMGGTRFFGASSTIPIKLCPGNVVPVIFASSIISMPQMIATFMGKSPKWLNFLDTSRWFDRSQMIYSLGAVLYIAMIFGFSFFYIGIEFNTIEVADNIRKSGGTVPGIRPSELANYLKEQMKYTIILGAIALSIIAMVPVVLGGLFGLPRISFLGTSIIITVGVILETKKALEAATKGLAYEKKLARGGIFNGAY